MKNMNGNNHYYVKSIDNIKMQTELIQKAIDDCYKAKGGTLVFKKGIYICGSIKLKSGVDFLIEKGAIIKQSEIMENYSHVDDSCIVHTTGSRFVFMHGLSVKNVNIYGGGIIDGNNAFDVNGSGNRGPLTLLFEHSKHITIKDINIVDSPGWSITFYASSYINILRVINKNSYADGIDCVCCQNVLYQDVYIEDVGDDGICIKNESAGYRVDTMPKCGYLSENILIENCTVNKSKNGHPPFKIGTGSNGIFRNIFIDNCQVRSTGALFTIQLMRPLMFEGEKRTIENIVVSNIVGEEVESLIDITSIDVDSPVIKSIVLKNIRLKKVAKNSIVQGLSSGAVENISFNSINIMYAENDNFMTNRLVIEGVREIIVNNCSTNNSKEFCDIKHTPCLSNITDKTDNEDLPQLISSNVPLILDGEIKHEVIHNNTAILKCIKLTTKQQITPNSTIIINAIICNEGDAGMVRIEPTIHNGKFKPLWIYMKCREQRKITMESDKVYTSGCYEVKIDDCTANVLVEESTGVLEDCNEVWFERKNLTKDFEYIKSKIMNVGGTSILLNKISWLNKYSYNNKNQLAAGEECYIEINTLEDLEEYKNKLETLQRIPRNMTTYTNNTACFGMKNGDFIIRAGGTTDRYDEIHTRTINDYSALYEEICGNFTVIVKVKKLEKSGMYASAGILISNDIESENCPYNVSLNTTPKYGGFGMFRADTEGKGKLNFRKYTKGQCPIWYKVNKNEKKFSAYFSFDGLNWTLIEVIDNEGANEKQYVGLFANGFSRSGKPGEAIFEGYTLSKID